MKISVLIVLFLLVFVKNGSSQDVDTIPEPEVIRYRVIGLNMTPLIGQLVPFSRQGMLATGPYFIHYRSYKNDKAFRLSIGWRLVPNLFFEEVEPITNFINLRIGGEKIRHIYGPWSYIKGVDAVFIAGNLNVGDRINPELLIGVGLSWGIAYQINDHISVDIETAMLIGVLPASLRFVPPIGINLNYKFPPPVPKQKKESKGGLRSILFE